MQTELPGAKAFLAQFAVSDLSGYAAHAVGFTRMYHGDHLCLLASHLPVTSYTASKFFADYTWIVLCSGFNPRIVQAKFGSIGKILGGFNPHSVTKAVVARGTKILNHKAKWEALVYTAWLLKTRTWEQFQETYLGSIEALERLPRIGGITRYRLALCIGLDVVGPSEHLNLVESHFGITGSQLLCKNIQVSVPQASDLYLCQIEFCLWTYLSHLGKVQPCCVVSTLGDI